MGRLIRNLDYKVSDMYDTQSEHNYVRLSSIIQRNGEDCPQSRNLEELRSETRVIVRLN